MKIAKSILIGTITWAMIAPAAKGAFIAPFKGWSNLMNESSNIIIAQCTKTPTNCMYEGFVDSPIQVSSVLKGDAKKEDAHVVSRYWPRQGEYYLIFAKYDNGVFRARESYMVVLLGMNGPPDLSGGKTLEEKIHILLQWRLKYLDRHMKEEREEKQRLEGAFPQTNSVPAVQK